jgi:hypothetical protein
MRGICSITIKSRIEIIIQLIFWCERFYQKIGDTVNSIELESGSIADTHYKFICFFNALNIFTCVSLALQNLISLMLENS